VWKPTPSQTQSGRCPVHAVERPVTEYGRVNPAHEPLPVDEQTGRRNTVAGGGSSRVPGAKTSHRNGNGKK
jgi:hypothetical protein